MTAILYGFSIADQSHSPIWFYHRESAENYIRFNRLDWQIETAREDDINPLEIGDSEDTIWTPHK